MMTRNLKALGILALAALAMSAMFASAAQAEGTKGVFTAGATPEEHKPATIIGEQYGEVNFFEAFGTKTECVNEQVKFTGTDPDGTAKEITISPHYSHCLSTGNRPTTVTMNGCDYIFTQPTTAEGVPAGSYTGKVDLTCPHENAIEVHVYDEGTVTNHANQVCRLTIFPTGEVTQDGEETSHRQQTLGGHAVYTPGTVEGKHDLTVDVTASEITVKRDGICTLLGDPDHISNATYESTVTVKAFEDEQEPHDLIELWISKEAA